MLEVYGCRFDDGAVWHVTVPDIDHFRDDCLEAIPRLLPFCDRIGRCFWFDLLLLTRRYGIAAHEVLEPILHLEFGEPSHGIKPATPFTRPPLKGLWHKHWTSARFLAANILAVAQRKDSMDWIWEIAKEGDLLTEEMIGQIAHRMTFDAYKNRHVAKRITGEWIIFLPHAGHNYYLCLGTHKIGDDRLNEKIRTLCTIDFPDLTGWIDDAAAKPESSTSP